MDERTPPAQPPVAPAPPRSVLLPQNPFSGGSNTTPMPPVATSTSVTGAPTANVPSVSRPTVNATPQEELESTSRFAGRGSRIRLIILGVVAVLFVGVLLWAWWSRTPAENAVNPITESVEDLEPVITVPTVNTNTNTAPVREIRDADGDGLLDAEENQAGTSPTQVDSDSDGLTDREEVRIYNTNPLNPDTDGDTYKDGEEVRQFYNPNGSGKLLNTQEAINSFNQETN